MFSVRVGVARINNQILYSCVQIRASDYLQALIYRLVIEKSIPLHFVLSLASLSQTKPVRCSQLQPGHRVSAVPDDCSASAFCELFYVSCLPAGCRRCVQEEERSSTSPSSPPWREQRCCRPTCRSKKSTPPSEASRWSLSAGLRSCFFFFFAILLAQVSHLGTKLTFLMSALLRFINPRSIYVVNTKWCQDLSQLQKKCQDYRYSLAFFLLLCIIYMWK